MKRNFKKVLALILTLCMILPQMVLAASSYSVTLEIRDTRDNTKVVQGSSSAYGSAGSLLAAEVVGIINEKYEELETTFSGSGFRSIVDTGLSAFSDDTKWANYVSRYYNDVTDTNTQSLKDVLKDKTSTFGKLTADVPYVMTYETHYQVTLTLNEHGGGGGGGGAGETVMTVPALGDADNQVKIEATIQGSTAVLSVSEPQLQQLLDNEQRTNTVVKDTFATIDLSGLPKKLTGVSIPTQTVEMILEATLDPRNKTMGMQINLPNGLYTTFDAQAMEAILDQTTGKQVMMVVEVVEVDVETLTDAQKKTIERLNEPLVVDAYLLSDGMRIHDFYGGTVEVWVPYDWDGKGTLHSVYLEENGNATPIPSVYQDDFVIMTLHHFSNYVIYITPDCDGGVGCPGKLFTDVDTGAWYHDGIDFVVNRGWMKGVSETRFAPHLSTTRGMIVTILYRVENCPDYTYANTFPDVTEGQYYTEAVAWGVANGVIKGYGNGNYGPNDLVTREQIAAIFHRYSNYKGYDVSIGETTSLDGFHDAWYISGYAVPCLQWAVGAGLVQGYDNGALMPREPATRAQVATMLMRYFSQNG